MSIAPTPVCPYCGNFPKEQTHPCPAYEEKTTTAALPPPGRGMVPMSLREIAEATSKQAHVRSDHVIEIVRATEEFHGITAAAATALGDGEGAK